jgi:hypothetical protein
MTADSRQRALEAMTITKPSQKCTNALGEVFDGHVFILTDAEVEVIRAALTSTPTPCAALVEEISEKKAASLERIQARDEKDESWNDGYDHGVVNMCDWMLAAAPPQSAKDGGLE